MIVLITAQLRWTVRLCPIICTTVELTSGILALSPICFQKCHNWVIFTRLRSARSLWGQPSTFSRILCKAWKWLIWVWGLRTFWTAFCPIVRPSTWYCPMNWNRTRCRGRKRGAEVEITELNNLQGTLLQVSILERAQSASYSLDEKSWPPSLM